MSFLFYSIAYSRFNPCTHHHRRGQLAALTEEVRSQFHHHRSDGEQSEDADADSNNFNNAFGQSVGGNQQVPVQETRPGLVHWQVPQR